MRLLPFLSFVLLVTFAQHANSQTPIPSPFWKEKDKSIEQVQEKEEPKLEMSLFPTLMACSDEQTFNEFVRRKGYDFSSFTGESEVAKNITVLFYHNEKTNEFAVVRTDGERYCILEMGKQNLGSTLEADKQDVFGTPPPGSPLLALVPPSPLLEDDFDPNLLPEPAAGPQVVLLELPARPVVRHGGGALASPN